MRTIGIQLKPLRHLSVGDFLFQIPNAVDAISFEKMGNRFDSSEGLHIVFCSREEDHMAWCAIQAVLDVYGQDAKAYCLIARGSEAFSLEVMFGERGGDARRALRATIAGNFWHDGMDAQTFGDYSEEDASRTAAYIESISYSNLKNGR